MTVKELISCLEAQASPDAEVRFVDSSGRSVRIQGGILADVRQADGAETFGLHLADFDCSRLGGF